MEGRSEVINQVLVHLFNELLRLEEKTLRQEGVKGLSIREVHIIEAVCGAGEDSNHMSALAAQLGLPQRSYSYYETGQHMMPLEILRALARFYGVSTDYLLELTDDPTPPPPSRNAAGK